MTTRTESWLMRRWGKWVVPYAALWITMLVGGVVVVLLALLSAEVYDNVVDDAGLANLDKPTLAFMEQLRSPGLDSFVTGFTNIGGGIGMPILASILTAWLIWASRTWRPLILIGAAAAVSTTATTLGKKLIGRNRPDHADAVPPYEDSPSFPSGHTLNTTVVIGLVVYLACLQVKRTIARVALIAAGVIFVVGNGDEPGLPGPSLDDRCDLRMAAGAGVGGDRDHGPQALPCAAAPGTSGSRAHVRPPRAPQRRRRGTGSGTGKDGRSGGQDDVGARGPTGGPPAAG